MAIYGDRVSNNGILKRQLDINSDFKENGGLIP